MSESQGGSGGKCGRILDFGLAIFEVSAGSHDPGAAQKSWPSTPELEPVFLDTVPKPRWDDAHAGRGHVCFVDAAHFVFGRFL